MEPSNRRSSNTNNMQVVLTSAQFPNQYSLSNVYNDIESLSGKELSWKDGKVIYNIFKFCHPYLKNNYDNYTLQDKLKYLLPQVFEIKNILPKILKLGHKINFLLSTEKGSSISKAVKTCELDLSTLSAEKPQNIFHLLEQRKLGSRTSSNSFIDPRIIQNIKNKKYVQTIFKGHEKGIKAFDVQDHFVATVSPAEYSIKLWDTDTGKCLWTFNPEPKVQWNEKIKIANGYVICSGHVHTPDQFKFDRTIRIIDVKTGKETAAITNQKLDLIKLVTNGKHLFCPKADNEIGMWNLDGSLLKSIDSEKLADLSTRILCSKNFLVVINKKNIFIHNLNKNVEIKLRLQQIQEIFTACIDESSLICGFRDRTGNEPDCCEINLETGQLIKLYEKAYSHANLNAYEPNTVYKVIKNKDWTFLGHGDGMLTAVNLGTNVHVKLGGHSSSVSFLATEGQILISGSDGNSAELKFWDIKSMKQIGEMTFPSLQGISLISGKVFAAVEKSLFKWDFQLLQ